MVSKEELRSILIQEETKERWASIKGSKRIAKAKANEKYWKKALGPYYDEAFGNPKTPAIAVSDVVKKKEIKRYNGFDEVEYLGTLFYASAMSFYTLMGLVFLIWMFSFVIWPEESCLSC